MLFDRHLIIHWAGKNSSVIVVLTKNEALGHVIASNVYFSYDYGASYQVGQKVVFRLN